MDPTRVAIALSLLPGRGRFEVVGRLAVAGIPGREDETAPRPPVDVLVAWLERAWPEHAGAFAPLARRLDADAARALERAATRGLQAVTFLDAAYPPLLRQLPDAPAVLWMRGDAGSLAGPAVAVVGARSASTAAVHAARRLGTDLAGAGVVVVSGLARGIDAAAHDGALETGRTVAVLGSGVDLTYPPEHGVLADRIVALGAVVSELPPGCPPRRHQFPLRNRLISGLARAVVVVEAGERSGALITARYALDQGREVMAMPGQVAGGRNRGAHGLINDGALLVESAEDVLAALQRLPGWTAHLPAPRDDGEADDPLLAALVPGLPVEIDRLVVELGWPAPQVLARVATLEVAGTVERSAGGCVVRVVPGRGGRADGKW